MSSLQALREAEQGYSGGITAIDKEFARLLKGLDESDMWEDTIVVYTSDHGEMMDSHGRRAKQMPHEESCRVPFFVRLPAGRANGSRRSDALFASVDIYPNLCGLAGIPVPALQRARPVAALFGVTAAQNHLTVFLMNEQGPPNRQEVQTYRGVRTHTLTLRDAAWMAAAGAPLRQQHTTIPDEEPYTRSSKSAPDIKAGKRTDHVGQIRRRSILLPESDRFLLLLSRSLNVGYEG